MCVDFDDDVSPSFCVDVWYRARKPHRCSECARPIEKGEQYVCTRGMWDGNISVYKRCAHCEVLREWLAAECGGWMYGDVVSDVREHIQDYGVSQYGFGLARLVVLAQNDWRRAGQLVPVPTIPMSTHQRNALAKAAA